MNDRRCVNAWQAIYQLKQLSHFTVEFEVTQYHIAFDLESCCLVPPDPHAWTDYLSTGGHIKQAQEPNKSIPFKFCTCVLLFDISL